MSSSTQNRGQAAPRYERLKKRVDTVKVSDMVSIALLEVARSTLEMFAVFSPSQAGSMGIPSWTKVKVVMQSLLPAPSGVFNDAFFRNPLFPVLTLRDISAFYGCPQVESSLDELHLSSQDGQNRSIRTHVWFAKFMECDSGTVIDIVKMYKFHRISTDLQRRLSISLTPPEVRMEPFVASISNKSQRQTSLRDAKPKDEEYHSTEAVTADAREQDKTHSHRIRLSSDYEYQDGSDSRKATHVFQYFKDNKFSGDLSQSIQLTLRDYNICARQHKLSVRQKADFFVNVLADPARMFFFNHSKDDMLFDQIARMMTGEYNSDARQLQVQGMFETLRLDKHMSEYDISSHADGLTKIIDLIERLTPQCQPQFLSDANKINYLRKAVLGFQWAMVPIGNIITARYSFNSFVTALREHLQLENEVTLANPFIGSRPYNSAKETYHQQCRRNPKYVRKHVLTTSRSRPDTSMRSSKMSFEESHRKGVCHRCQQKWIPEHRCQPGTIRSYVRNRFKNGDSATLIVSDLVSGLEGESEASAKEEATPSDNSDNGEREEIHYGEAHSELGHFDKLMDENTQSGASIEEVDKEWFTNHLYASLEDGSRPSSHPSPSEF